jgi:hypothetical protein
MQMQKTEEKAQTRISGPRSTILVLTIKFVSLYISNAMYRKGSLD